jgi:hypothetical protein
LSFGTESRLVELRPTSDAGLHATRSFLQVPSRCLKLFRIKLEFE